MKQRFDNSTAERVINILDYLTLTPGSKSITEISKYLQMSKSTVYRIMSSLEKAIWVTQNPTTGRYYLGAKSIEFSLSIISRIELRTVALPYLKQLQSTSSETATS